MSKQQKWTTSAGRSIAVVTVYDAPGLGKAGRDEIAAWLRHVATELEDEGADYSPRYTARYLGPMHTKGAA